MAEFHTLPPLSDKRSSHWISLDKEAEIRAKSSDSAVVPSLDHARQADFQQVYEPSDDTFLLMDGIQLDMKENNSRLQEVGVIMEIGCGSGVPLVFLASLLHAHRQGCFQAIATDINPRALHFAQKTAIENGITSIDFIQCNLASSLLPRMEHSVDVLLFNPPYVPTPDEEVNGNGIEASWAGGQDGRIVIDRAIPQIARLLSQPHGTCYMITVDDNQPEQLSVACREHGLRLLPLVRRKAYNEYLTVQKISVLLD